MAERKMPSVEDYPSNANGSKPVVVKEEVKPIVKGKVTRKPSFGHGLRDEFISEDAPNVGSYILYDVLIPALGDLLRDIAHGSIDMVFGGGRGGYARRSGYRPSNDRSYISYNRMYDDRNRSKRDRDEERYSRRRGHRDLDEFTFEYREDAEDVLDRMCDYIERYGDVPVSYFYDLCGETVPGDFTADDWGWVNLSQARVTHGRRGYFIDFPRAREL